MCTLTILPLTRNPSGVRVAVNRDESVLRSAAWPPRVIVAGERSIVLPIDPDGGGTWIGASDAGLAMALLNTYPPPQSAQANPPYSARANPPYSAQANPPTSGKAAPPLHSQVLSRGTIIPQLLAHANLAAAVEAGMSLDPLAYRPFRLVMTNPHEVIEISSSGGSMHLLGRRELSAPLMFTSSGIGDAAVDAPRRKLFEEVFAQPDAEEWPHVQDAFHRHSWPDAPQLSVCMRRPDARTVSHTVVEIHPSAVSMTYWPAPPDEPSDAVEIWLHL